ncbi:MAG: UDP-N-acetylmuramoyl-L-alanyl-D-glutamate--2,6-diaminopimelate ligase [Burkholderiales bacterium]|nr:UDP-N-acetylmuramoyl-L-alanyl-D-glutamate--2,6-diaminopimelate ligase [Burkholderiales bacterium]
MSVAHPADLTALDALGVRPAGVRADSREVRAGDLFAAFPGERSDGRRFIGQALRAGAAAVVWERAGFSWDSRWQVPNLPMEDVRGKLGFIADRVYGQPSRRMWVAGVTGTNGKTSCSHWIAQSLGRCGRRTAVLGTLGNGFPGALRPAIHTTPDAASVHECLSELLAGGAAGVAMEVSSHGLEQGRVNGVAFAAALFTNLSRDHLDYHGTMEDYGAAKARLFRWPGLRHAVINLDDAFGARLAASLDRSRVQVLGYGLGKGDIAGHRLDLGRHGLTLEIETPWGPAAIRSRLLGGFNASNLLGVLGILLAAGLDPREAAESLAELEPVAGRLQQIQLPGRPTVVVDYAHTPDALQKVLETLRGVLPAGGRLICVFGCGGERDPGKRPLMGEVATRLADSCVITSDNPRGEDPFEIIRQIVAGAHPSYAVEEDRAGAIHRAIASAAPEDIVLIAGKGHEPYQEIGGMRLPFSDFDVACAALHAGEA